MKTFNPMIARGGLARISLLALTVSAALVSHAADIQRLPAAAGDLIPSRLASAREVPALPSRANRTQELVQFQWPVLDTAAVIESGDRGSHNTSRQYWLDVSADQLSRGVHLSTTANGAVIRVSPLALNGGPALARDTLELSRNGQVLDNASAIAAFATTEQLRASGAPFAEGTVAFRLTAAAGNGDFTLKANTGATGDSAYVVHVFDTDSAISAEMATNLSSYLAGTTIDSSVTVSGANGRVNGFLLSPDGKTSMPLNFRRNGEQYVASVDAPGAEGTGLWELHTHFQGTDRNGLQVLRDTKTAINISAPTARLGQEIVVTSATNDSELGFALDVEVAAAGRYQLSAVLYGTNSSGTLQPVAMAQSAQWLESGAQQLPLTFDVSEGGFSAPFELRDLRLQDQSRLGLLQREARALIVKP